MCTDVSHLHMDIGCHVNSIDPTTSFGTQNESCHFKWRDSSMSRATPFDMTHFWLKSVGLFSLSFTIFL
jgi:hypothetical protein